MSSCKHVYLVFGVTKAWRSCISNWDSSPNPDLLVNENGEMSYCKRADLDTSKNKPNPRGDADSNGKGRGSTFPVPVKEQFCRKDLKLGVANTGLIDYNFQELKCPNKNVLEKYFHVCRLLKGQDQNRKGQISVPQVVIPLLYYSHRTPCLITTQYHTGFSCCVLHTGNPR